MPPKHRHDAQSPVPSTPAAPRNPDSLPPVTTPPVPAGYVPPTAYEMLGWHPRQGEIAIAADVVEELRAFKEYGATFGATVPPSEEIASLLDVARKWRMERDAAEAWNIYVRGQDAMAWRVALERLDELKPAYKLAAGRNPALASSYPRLADFFDTHKQIAQRATATKKKQKALASAPLEMAPVVPEAPPSLPSLASPKTPTST